MAKLSTNPGSITQRQITAIWSTARGRGLSSEQVHEAAGGSLAALSRKQASDLIDRLGGGGLPNPPGEAPPPARHRAKPGVTRMITPEQIEQITGLLLDVFDDAESHAYAWLDKMFKVDSIRALATAKRAGEVIRVLKEMRARRRAKPALRTDD